MQVIRTVAEMEATRAELEGSVGVIPTMGYLHEGHLSLVRRCVAENDHSVAWIFVNPTQFGPGEDLERYPRDEARDLSLLEAQGTDIVFVPSADEVYPPGFDEWVEVHGPLTERLEGAHRPGHFRGVTTVVARMFRIIRPHRAYFGRKDAQQLRVVRRMVAEQGISVEIVGMPIVREADGLAMSSRNVYLSSEDRAAALALSRSLRDASAMVAEGEWDARKVRGKVTGALEAESRLAPDYVSVVDEETFEEIDGIDRPALLLVAATVGSTRLIDNVELFPADLGPIGRG
jgi:pantoate--beta-alanine ligase